ncbi:MAG: hypothetical protein GY803_17115, partial [Chloroflexi bacterium]|nr:hypothetical protein [Chloroflexota bacterium]
VQESDVQGSDVQGSFVEETAEKEALPESDLFAADWPEEGGEDEASEEEPSAIEPETTASDWGEIDSILSHALQEEMPDWLDEFGQPMADKAELREEETPLISDEESLPDWIAQMKPGTVHTGSGISSLADATETLGDLSSDLGGADLPDWLQDADDLPGDILPLEGSPDLPEWLKSDSGATTDGDLMGRDSQPPLDASSEWTAVLQELPKAMSAKESLSSVELPEWIQALKPRELSGEEAEPEPEKPALEVGPLTGIRDVVDIEPAIAHPHENGKRRSFVITNEQKSQATLLKQLALAERGAVGAVADDIAAPQAALSAWTRIILVVLLLAAIAAGLFLPNLLPHAPITPSPRVEQAYSAVEDAAGLPVLLAIEYTPALAGELDILAETLTNQLTANGSPIITVSQYAAGTAVAQTLTDNQISLGLIPGDTIGLRQLGDCLAKEAADDSSVCNTIVSRDLDSSTQQALADVGLIIVLTGERNSLVGWLEQVGRSNGAPIVAGVAQSLGPTAAPYFASSQLQGMIVGMPDTAVYQQMAQSQPTDSVIKQLSAQTLAQLLAAAVLLAGGLGYGVSGLFKRGV